MPPQENQPQFMPRVALAQNSELIVKKITNAGKAVLRLGYFFLFLGIISVLFMIGQTFDSDLKRALLVTAGLVPASIYWIFAGTQIRRNTDNAQKALSIMKIVLITAIVLTIWRIGIAVTLKDSHLGISDFTIVLAIYLLVAMSRIKKLAK